MGLVDPRLYEYYGTLYSEKERLSRREGQIELARTKELLARYLPHSPCSILDVGGGPGVYASWLASLGHRVHLVDLVPAHVEESSKVGTFSASLGDARSLKEPDESYDVVLLLGPLYHLLDRQERDQALWEAKRVARPGGLIAGAFITRGAVALDGFVKDWIFEGERNRMMEETARRGFITTGESGFGGIARFHLPSEVREEMSSAGLKILGIFGLEGPAWISRDFDERWNRPRDREIMLGAARAVEADPELQVLSAHLLAVTRRP